MPYDYKRALLVLELCLLSLFPVKPSELTDEELKLVYLGFYLIQQRTDPNQDSTYLRNALYHDVHCLHNNVKFLPWHREYMIRFEEDIQLALKAHGVTDEQASAFRLPYFDVNVETVKDAIPEAFTVARVTINLAGKDVEIDNPLFNYRLERDLVSSIGSFPQGAVTGRGGTVEEANVRWRQEWSFMKEQFTRSMAAKTFSQFLNSLDPSGDSLESPHSLVHIVIGDFIPGLESAMTWVPISSLEPIFWFHHCNIDRLWHEWQILRNFPEWDDSIPGHSPTDPLVPWEATYNDLEVLHDHPNQLLDHVYVFRRENPEQCANCRENEIISIPLIVRGNPQDLIIKFIRALDNVEHPASEFGEWVITVRNTIVPR
jgi:hypothetical protein